METKTLQSVGLEKRRKRTSLFRVLSVQNLETRVVLSGLSLVDVDVQGPAHSEYHFDELGNTIHVLPKPTQNVEATTVTGEGTIATPTLADTFRLHSNPGAAQTIFLDFDGHTTSGTSWNSFTSGADFITPAFNFTGDSSFADSELARIQAIWERVAEDFIPFDVDVTTEEPSLADLSRSGSGDSKWGVRVVIGGDGAWYGSAGGLAYIGSFNWSDDTPVFVFEDNLANGHEKYTAEAIAHEAGHSLGLNHDGRTSPTEEYYAGHGSGATGWAPLMGVSYYKELTQWSNGDYLNASTKEDDLAVITTRNGFGYRADDHGDTSAVSTAIDTATATISASGIIETNDDVDVFTFVTESGDVQLDLLPFYRGPNLDIAATLFDTAGSLIASSNPLGMLSASITTTLAAGQYFLHVTGAGQGDPLNGGYSDYGSLGSYSVSGTVVPSSAALINISADNADQIEGDSGTKDFTFTVSRSGDTSGEASVNWSVAGSGSSAADASDFAGGVLPSGIVTFAAGESTKAVFVGIAGDLDSEADETFEVVLSNASTGSLIATSRAIASIRNDDLPPAIPGITVTPIGGLTTSESGDSASFTVVLQSRPTSDVVIPISSSNTNEGVTSVSSLMFTLLNWDAPQTVQVNGVDDSVRDGNVSYTITIGAAVSSDQAYDGMDAADLDATNQDNEKGKRDSTGGGGGGGGGGGPKGRKNAPTASSQSVDIVEHVALWANDPASDSGDQWISRFEATAAEIVETSNAKRTATTWQQDACNLGSDDCSLAQKDEAKDSSTKQFDTALLDTVWTELGHL